MLSAIIRPVSRSIQDCQLTHLERRPIDLERARRQHASYVDALTRQAVQVITLPEAPDLPDSVFVEDTALVLDELAVMTRPGAAARRAEVADIADALQPYRELSHLQPPACLDGGDVLRVGSTFYIGRSSRSNADAVEQLSRLLAPFGYRVASVPMTGCLHLKSAVTLVAEGTLLINSDHVEKRWFPRMHFIDVDPAEPSAANALMLPFGLLFPAAFPRTCRRLEAAGLVVESIEMDELAKAEGAVTCCSILFRNS